MAAESGGAHPHPLAVSAHYLSAARPGAAVVHVEVLKRGRATTVMAARLLQDHEGEERVRLVVTATYADLTQLSDEVATTAVRPAVPAPEQCIPTSMAPPEMKQMVAMLDRFDLLADPATLAWSWGEPSGQGVIQGLFRLGDGVDMDPLGLLLAVDALPPVSFDLGRPGWAPTLELTVHVRAIPAPGWVQVRHSTRNVAGGYFEEDCEVWDSTGRLVAQSRQLAGMPRAAND